MVCDSLSRNVSKLTHSVLHLMMPSPLDISLSVTAWPHVHTSSIACKSLAFHFWPRHVAGPSSVNGWLPISSGFLVGAAISTAGGSSLGTSGETGAGSAGL